MSTTTMLKRPSGFLPIVMSSLALALVIWFVGTHAVVREPDENAAARIWQLLMAAQVPIIAYFAMTSLPRAPKQAVRILTVQVCAALAALAPVYLLRL